jgi:hypothetical protein
MELVRRERWSFVEVFHDEKGIMYEGGVSFLVHLVDLKTCDVYEKLTNAD